MVVMDDMTILGAKGLCIVHMNVASILGAHKFEMMRQQVENSYVDVFCASETWLTCCQPDSLIALKGFNVTRLDRSWKGNNAGANPKKGGGLICYVNDKIN